MAELRHELLRLPAAWSHGVTRGGRVFFLNEEAQSTTWLHPATGQAVISGHRTAPDLPTGWEEGYSFEGARYYINHNERKVTCKHPVTGLTSQENCIFVMNEEAAATMASQERKERPVSVVSEVSNYTMASEMTLVPMSPVGRSSRSSKKIHNFGKRSNSIKRNANAPVIKRGWLYKQDSTGMKLWKKRWFVLADLCLFYYRDDKEEGILGSILLPSFKIGPVSPEDHINRKYAFKAAHPNMRTYYFYTDTVKEMESWMKVMIEAALVQTEPVKRIEKVKSENLPPQEANNHIVNHKMLMKPEAPNQKNKDPTLSLQTIDNSNLGHADKYGFDKDRLDKPLTKINSINLHSTKLESPNVMSSKGTSSVQAGQYKPIRVNSSTSSATSPAGAISAPMDDTDAGREMLVFQNSNGRGMQRTNSMVQLEQWVRTQKERGQEDEPRSITCYQTLPRNMPSYRAQAMPRYRTMPRHSTARPESICTLSSSSYDRVLGPRSADDKRRSMRDDTMWQLYEWQQRQVYQRQGTLPRHGTLSTPVTMVNIVEQSHSIPASPSHGSLVPYQVYSPLKSYDTASRSELSSPILRGDMTIDSSQSRRHRTPVNRFVYPPNRRSMPAGLPGQNVNPENLQGKTPEELTLLLIKLRRQQAELNSIREHTLAQLVQLNLSDANPKMAQHEDCREALYNYGTEDLDIDAKLSQLCEQGKVVHEQEEKLQQLHKEKHTLEQALLAASQEIEMNPDKPNVVQSVAIQRDVLQNGLLSTCREVSRATTELERGWSEYDKLEYDVTYAQNQLKEQLDRLEGIETELTAQQHAQIQKELWRIQDVMEGLNKNKQQRSSLDPSGNTDGYEPLSDSFSVLKYRNEEEGAAPPRPPLPHLYDLTEMAPTVPPLPSESSLWPYSAGELVHPPDETKTELEQEYPNNEAYSGPDYRLYKSEPELTTVTEVDESNVDEKSEGVIDKESGTSKGMSFPVGIVPPRTKSPMPESATIASYVTLRKHRKMDGTTPYMERPKSAVDQLFLAESPRPRMSIEEQLERIKRHQQASLKEKRKGLNLIAVQDQSPSRSQSRENFQAKPTNPAEKYSVRRSRTVECNIKELEAAVREDDSEQPRETAAEEIARLKEEDAEPDQYKVHADKEISKRGHILKFQRCIEDESEISDPNETPKKEQNVDRIKDSIDKNSLQSVIPVTNHKTENSVEEDDVQEQDKINISYELATEATKRSIFAAEKSSSPSQSTTSQSSPHPQLTEGSHFMCV
ncbi:pleckstrin homology domain-containing family A member 5 isoform X3 [Callorhinchus milii]|uniref:pleckstrin homology domain-containing family A member 5 isoform X3 n=1 Tax=Callorhinchus milii TaxID=7868 RepID=UPI001C3F8BD7|nr:pleckstrin homology domain-containing family A member 5 isoform X3 [Callorhinchus milii]